MDSPSTPVVHPLTPATPPKKLPVLPLAVAAVIIVGSLSGFLLSRLSPATSGVVAGNDIVQTTNEVGSTNTETYRDAATGVIEAGGLNGEGTHKLMRDGGPSQTVYMISSVIDLDQYVGKKVEVWGLTLDAVKASWLMDVGRLKVLE